MQLRWAHRARRDLLKLGDYYESVEPGLGEHLLEKIEQAPLILLDQPKLGPGTGRGRYRKWTVRGTPFVLTYRVLHSAVEIARVHHSASDWRKS
jgi:toxin ParE1/3/4